MATLLVREKYVATRSGTAGSLVCGGQGRNNVWRAYDDPGPCGIASNGHRPLFRATYMH